MRGKGKVQCVVKVPVEDDSDDSGCRRQTRDLYFLIFAQRERGRESTRRRKWHPPPLQNKRTILERGDQSQMPLFLTRHCRVHRLIPPSPRFHHWPISLPSFLSPSTSTVCVCMTSTPEGVFLSMLSTLDASRPYLGPPFQVPSLSARTKKLKTLHLARNEKSATLALTSLYQGQMRFP